MKILGKDKPILVSYAIWDNVKCAELHFTVPVEETIFKNQTIAIKSDTETFLNNLNLSTNIPPNSKLFFHNSSKFPRYKLENTKFERKIKEDKADYIVVNTNLELTKGYKYTVWESEKDIVLTIDHITLVDNKDYTNLGEYYELNVHEYNFLDFLQNKPSKPLISDQALNAICDSTFPDITKKVMMEIYNMLQSDECATRDLGLKLLASHNTAKFPLTSRCLAGLTLMNGIARNVTVKNLFTSLGVKPHNDPYGRKHFSYANGIWSKYIEGKSSSDEDKKMCLYILNYYVHSNNIEPYYYYRQNVSWYDKNFKA